jgi:hypothetical protein
MHFSRLLTYVLLDIGKPNPAGDAIETAPGNWTVTGSGNDIWVSAPLYILWQ